MTQQARLVINHSTNLKGLIKVLNRLAQIPGIKTITPGRIAHTNSRPCPLKIRITVPISGGFKLQARAERAAQEIFVITALSEAELDSAIQKSIK